MERYIERLENLRNRAAKSSENPEDLAEVLDEQEQERIIAELKKQNETSNGAIKLALASLPILVGVLFVLFGHDILYPLTQLSSPEIPLPITDEPVVSKTPFPFFCAFLSLMSLFQSTLYVLSTINEYPLPIPTFLKRNTTMIFYSMLLTSLVTVILSIRTSWIELLFWSLPLGVALLNFGAMRMMQEIEMGMAELERSKYHLRGA